MNNTFENIGNYIPEGYIVRKDWTGYNTIANVTPLAGCCIMLEGSDNVFMEGNVFRNVLNGIATSSPDALGNFGNFTIKNNTFNFGKTLLFPLLYFLHLSLFPFLYIF